MNKLRKQEIWYSLFAFIGVILGYINLMLLYPNALSQAQFGMVQWLITVSGTICIVAQIGLPNIAIRYFPYFKNEANKHHNFLGFLLLGILLCSFLGTLLVFCFESSIIQLFSEAKSEQLIKTYYWYIVPLLALLTSINVLDAYVIGFQKTAITAFFRDVFLRVGFGVLLIGCLLQWWDFTFFLNGIIAVYALQVAFYLWFIYKIGALKINLNFGGISSVKLQEFLKYGIITMFSSASFFLIMNIDLLMVSFFSSEQLNDTGIYVIFQRLGVVIGIPYMAYLATGQAIIPKAFKEKDINSIEVLYKKSSLVVLTLGILLLSLVWANLDNIITLLGNDYGRGKWVAVFIGLSTLINISTSVNGIIIINSPFYRYNLYLNFGFVLVSILTNYIFINWYGLVGAAIGTMVSMIMLNLAKVAIVKWQLNIQPFSKNTLVVIFLGIGLLLFNTVLPALNHWLFDVIYRSLVLSIIFLGIVLSFRLVPEINQTIASFKNKFLK